MYIKVGVRIWKVAYGQYILHPDSVYSLMNYYVLTIFYLKVLTKDFIKYNVKNWQNEDWEPSSVVEYLPSILLKIFCICNLSGALACILKVFPLLQIFLSLRRIGISSLMVGRI